MTLARRGVLASLAGLLSSCSPANLLNATVQVTAKMIPSRFGISSVNCPAMANGHTRPTPDLDRSNIVARNGAPGLLAARTVTT